MRDVSHPSLPILLQDLRDTLPEGQKSVPFSHIHFKFEEAGIPLILFFLCVMAAVPVPIPGLKVLLGIPIVILAVHLLLGKTEVKLPRRIMDQQIDANGLRKAIDKFLPYIEKLQHFTKPRMCACVGNAQFLRLMGFCATIMALSIFTPMPFSNTAPSICMVIMCTGLLYNDGALALVGAIMGTIWVVVLFSIVAIVGMEAFDWILHHFIALS